MYFKLWGPRKEKAIVRLYLSGYDGVYIDRYNRDSPLRIRGADPQLAHYIENSLRLMGIDLQQLGTRRALARELLEHRMLESGWERFAHTFINDSEEAPKPVKSVKSTITTQNNVIRVNFKKKR